MDKTCLIISGGDYSPVIPDKQYDLVIAADKGLTYAEQLHMLPDVLIGDFDSIAQFIDEAVCNEKDGPGRENVSFATGALRPDDSGLADDTLYPGRAGLGDAELETAQELTLSDNNGKDIKCIRLYKRKDDTDTMAAARYAVGNHCTEVTIACVMGGRFDHMLANLQTAAFLAKHGAVARLTGDQDEIWVFQNKALSFPKRQHWSFSVFSLSDSCKGVDITGAFYPVENLTLENHFPIGLGNDWCSEEITCSVKEGILAVIMSKMTSA